MPHYGRKAVISLRNRCATFSRKSLTVIDRHQPNVFFSGATSMTNKLLAFMHMAILIRCILHTDNSPVRLDYPPYTFAGTEKYRRAVD